MTITIFLCLFVLFTVIYAAALARATVKKPEYESPARTCKSSASNTPYIIGGQPPTAWDSANFHAIRRSILRKISTETQSLSRSEQDWIGRAGGDDHTIASDLISAPKLPTLTTTKPGGSAPLGLLFQSGQLRRMQ